MENANRDCFCSHEENSQANRSDWQDVLWIAFALFPFVLPQLHIVFLLLWLVEQSNRNCSHERSPTSLKRVEKGVSIYNDSDDDGMCHANDRL